LVSTVYESDRGRMNKFGFNNSQVQRFSPTAVYPT
jgi:hypothetical protein